MLPNAWSPILVQAIIASAVATLLGTCAFGKISVQTVIRLTGGGAMWLIEARY